VTVSVRCLRVKDTPELQNPSIYSVGGQWAEGSKG